MRHDDALHIFEPADHPAHGAGLVSIRRFARILGWSHQYVMQEIGAGRGPPTLDTGLPWACGSPARFIELASGVAWAMGRPRTKPAERARIVRRLIAHLREDA